MSWFEAEAAACGFAFPAGGAQPLESARNFS
jgi:hypothetical protein